ncbi:hypothetical protein [Mycobacterium pseudokansasii]|uniref:hypothetical protein n=1 Tax=Mycobacterium pseudokansasii TaxID=2341080 RepID=UPI000A4FF673|nr:hypothetical protein [Mycobacterium pseudokansasii]VBA32756.1 hypothetical protein LAUMK35_05309 [Mycobacterium pseudokansasii]VBA34416.1 hypothetical protein LAUMK21_05267 [Mycobacterium pseudokansasii]
MRATIEDAIRKGQLLTWGVIATGVLVETPLERGARADVAEAEAAIERLTPASADAVASRVSGGLGQPRGWGMKIGAGRSAG